MRIFYSIPFFLWVVVTQAQTPARLRVWLDPATERLMLDHGFEMDHGVVKKGVFIISDFSAAERQWLERAGIDFDVLIDDVPAYYRQRASQPTVAERSSRATCQTAEDTTAVPQHFSLGSMGGFYTYEEFLEHLDAMAADFPALITVKQPIDTFLTHEGRPVYWVKISDNAALDEAEPEVLYTSVHHAREPQSLTQLIFYMYHLLERYGSDPEVTHLVNNTEMYFVPMVNPDGYIQNQNTDPGGGGVWRKNRRDNGNGTFGVDLNRNYGFQWGHDNNGSSPNANSETYRGPAAFSEPEICAMKWFCEQHDFALALNYHSFGNYLIYPWGYTEQPLTPDSVEYIAFARGLTGGNNYVYGTGYETVGYATNGDSDDWMYGEQGSKNKIFSMTPETGTAGDGFWPAEDRIIPLSKENLRANLLLSHYAGNYLQVADRSPQVLGDLSGTIYLEAKRLGLRFDVPHTVELVPVSANISSVGAPVVLGGIDLAETQDLNITYTLANGTGAGEEVVFDIKTSMGSYAYTTRIHKIYGQPTVALYHSGNDATDLVSTGWGPTDEEYISPTGSIADSPYDFYENNSVNELYYNRVIDLRQSIKGMLQFSAKWAIEAGWDYCQVMASPVETDQWTPLCGQYTKAGNENQAEGQPLWDGFQNAWVQEQVLLDDYLGQRIRIKFRMVSDAFVNHDGFYLDDLRFVTLLDATSAIPLDTGYVDTTLAVMKAPGDPHTWRVFPNPASQQLILESGVAAHAELELYDVHGRLMIRQSLEAMTAVNTETLAEGLYILEIRSATGVQRERILIAR